MNKLIQICLLWAVVFLFPANLPAQLLYTTNNGSLTITKYVGSGNISLTIPSVVNGLPVTAIGPNAFMNAQGVMSITIPNSVVSLGTNAFYGSGLTYASIGSGVTNIGLLAFGNCLNLTTIQVAPQNPVYTNVNEALFDQYGTLITCPGGLSSYSFPNFVTNIAAWAFYEDSKLTGIYMPNSVTNIGDYAFYGCSGMTSVSLSTNLVSVGNSAFSDCGFGSFSMPNSVLNIGSNAFANCAKMIGFSLGNSVTNIGDDSFGGCSKLASIVATAANPFFSTVSGVLFDKNQITLMAYPPGKVGGSYTIPSTVNVIGDFAFYDNTILTNITIPESVTSIGNWAFADGLFTNFNLTSSVTNIGTAAFYFNSHLRGITVDAANPAYSSADGVLFNKNQSVLIQFPAMVAGSYMVPNGVTDIGFGAFAGNDYLTNVVIADSVTNLADQAFYLCDALTGLSLGTGLVNIGNSVFENCPLAGTLTIPDSVVNIGNYAFYENFSSSSTIALVFGTGVTNIGNYAFFGQPINNLTIPDNVVTIDNYAFADNSSLTNLVIGAGVLNIGSEAFYECYSLAGAYFAGNEPAGGAFIFDGGTVYYLPGTTGWAPTFGGSQAILWNPQAQVGDGSFGVGTNGFGFNIVGNANLAIVVEACTNLSDPIWIPVAPVTLTNGLSYFNDPNWTNFAGRYYRFRSP